MSDEHDYHAPATRTLQLAAELCGGMAEFAVRLGVTEAELAAWIRGERRPPNEAFFIALDIVAAGPFGSKTEDATSGMDAVQRIADRSKKKNSPTS